MKVWFPGLAFISSVRYALIMSRLRGVPSSRGDQALSEILYLGRK